MKKSLKLLSAVTGVALAFGCCALVGCGNGDKTPTVTPEKSCLVQVEGGTGGGYYYVNTNCTVTAEVPDGKQFIKWTAGTTDLSPNAEYTFTVTQNINLKAVFADDVPDAELATVEVHWGKGSGNYFVGTKIDISTVQEYIGVTFTGWEATYKGTDGNEVTEVISTESTFELTVEKDMYITACYDAQKLATPDNTTGQMFGISGGGAYELDRQKNGDGSKKTAFVTGCAYLLYTTYEKTEDDEFVAVGQGKVIPLPEKEGEYYHYMYSMDGAIKTGLKGGEGNIYQDTSEALNLIRTILNIELNKTYYISVRAMGGDDTPIDSEESAKYAVKF